MIRTLLFTILVTAFIANGNAQRKSELITQNQNLKFQLDSLNGVISKAKQGEKIAELKATEYQSQVKDLQDANETLLKNLNSFATLSSQNSENINKTLATLEIKENQLKGLVNGFASADSTALVVLTNAKRTLGENAKIQVSNSVVVVSEKLDVFFADGLGNTLLTSSKPFLANLAKVINANPEVGVTITGMTITGELDMALSQASTVAGVLIKENGVQGERIMVKGGDGGFKEAIQIKIHPDYKVFYEKTKEDIKN